MKIAWITNHDVTVEPIVTSLDYCAESLKIDKVERRDYTGICSYDVDGIDLVIYMGAAELEKTPPIKTLQSIREKTKLMMICCDASCGQGWGPILDIYHKEGCFDLIVNIDGSDNWVKHGSDYTATTPFDPRYFGDPPPWEPRPILLGFGGGANANRREIIRKIGSIITIHNRSEAYGSYHAYANFMKNCKFVLNMNERNTVKGRALETALAGAVLVEQRVSKTNNTFSKWFDESQFILYDNSEDIGELIFDHYDRAAEMAKAFHNEVKKNHNPTTFWKKVLEIVL